jgi:4'-phosphopantetheinyl transferase
MEATSSERIPSLLTRADLARADRFVRPEDRGRFLAARLGLLQILADHAGIHLAQLDLHQGPNGKLPGCGWQFNWSHSGDFVAWLVGRDPCGVDIELHDRRPSMDLASLFTEDEQAWIECSEDAPAAFMDLWTAKESVVKALGRGLSLDPRDVSIEMMSDEPMRHGPPNDWICRMEPSIAGRTRRVTSGGRVYSLSWCILSTGKDVLPLTWDDDRRTG